MFELEKSYVRNLNQTWSTSNYPQKRIKIRNFFLFFFFYGILPSEENSPFFRFISDTNSTSYMDLDDSSIPFEDDQNDSLSRYAQSPAEFLSKIDWIRSYGSISKSHTLKLSNIRSLALTCPV